MPADQQFRDLFDDHFGEVMGRGSFDAGADAQIGVRKGRRRQTQRRAVAGVAGLALVVAGAGFLGIGRSDVAVRPAEQFAQAPMAAVTYDAETVQAALEAEEATLATQRQQRAEALDLDPSSYVDNYSRNGFDALRLAPTPVPTPAVTPDFQVQMFVMDTKGDGPIMVIGEQQADRPEEPNNFTDYGQSGVIDTAANQQSTFGLDVDTASYHIAKTFICEQLMLPPAAAVRAEEFINSFDYGYPLPASGLGVMVDGAWIADRDAQNLHLVRVGVNTERVALDDRKPLAVTFAIDVSGSMAAPNRLGLVQASLALLVLELDEDDTVAIVTFNRNDSVILEPTPVGDGEAIIAAIDQLGARGSTNIEDGLRTAYRSATDSYREDANNLVILASDGMGNVRETVAEALVDRIIEEANNGINLATVGYGMDGLNDTFMEQLANQGNGFYAYLNDYEQAERFFRDDLSQLVVPVARDARAQVTFDPEFVESYRLIGYENRGLEAEDFRDDTVDAGELGAGHSSTALYEVRLTDFAMQNDVIAGTAAVRWQDPDTREPAEVWAPIQTGALAGHVDETSPSFQLAKTAADFAAALRLAGDGVNDGGEPAVDAAMFMAIADDATRLAAELDDPAVAEFAELVSKAAELG